MIHFTYIKFKRFEYLYRIEMEIDLLQFPIFCERRRTILSNEMNGGVSCRMCTNRNATQRMWTVIQRCRTFASIERWLFVLLDALNAFNFFFLCAHRLWFYLYICIGFVYSDSNECHNFMLIACFWIEMTYPTYWRSSYFGSARFLCHTSENTVTDDSESKKNSNSMNAYM